MPPTPLTLCRHPSRRRRSLRRGSVGRRTHSRTNCKSFQDSSKTRWLFVQDARSHRGDAAACPGPPPQRFASNTNAVGHTRPPHAPGPRQTANSARTPSRNEVSLSRMRVAVRGGNAAACTPSRDVVGLPQPRGTNCQSRQDLSKRGQFIRDVRSGRADTLRHAPRPATVCVPAAQPTPWTRRATQCGVQGPTASARRRA